MTNLLTLLEQLAQPFPPEAIEWLPGSATKDGAKCMAMAYADLRAYQERLDEVCGLDWSVAYKPWGDGRIICELTICGVTRSSTGEMAAQDEKNGMGGTVAEAQAMKRAAAMFGLGRYLYNLPAAWVDFDSAAKRISKSGQTELDNRYAAWYSKTVAAQAATKTTHKPADVVFSKPAPPHASAQQMDELNTLGLKFYGGAEWMVQRAKLAEAVTKGATSDIGELQPAEAARLIEGIQRKMAQLNGEVVGK